MIALEAKFAPTIEQGRGVFSPKDRNPHAPWNLGGDKMGSDRNGYAEAYASLLAGLDPKVVVELGVFRGVSVAMWCDLFPAATVVGLDLEFGRYRENEQNLRDRGAFRANVPVLQEWDAYSDDTDFMGDLPAVDLFVDDGPHTADAIRNVLRLVGPLMADGGVYVVEDFREGATLLAEAFPDAEIVRAGMLSAARL